MKDFGVYILHAYGLWYGPSGWGFEEQKLRYQMSLNAYMLGFRVQNLEEGVAGPR